MTIRVLIADDHRLVREGLRTYLDGEDDFDIVGEAASGREVLEILERPGAEADIVLLDYAMPDMNGIETTREIRKRHPDSEVVILSAYDDQDLIRESLRAGASGYVLKSTDTEELVRTARLVASGSMVLDPGAAHAVLEGLERRRALEGAGELTGRELEVLQLAAYGRTNKEIGTQLGIAPDTAKVHLDHIFRKLGVKDRTEAAAEALRRGLVR